MGSKEWQGRPGVIAGPALITALEGLASLSDNLRPEAAREVARQLMVDYGTEAVNVALQCQNFFLEQDADDTAAHMLEVLTAIWDFEDGQSAA